MSNVGETASATLTERASEAASEAAGAAREQAAIAKTAALRLRAFVSVGSLSLVLNTESVENFEPLASVEVTGLQASARQGESWASAEAKLHDLRVDDLTPVARRYY